MAIEHIGPQGAIFPTKNLLRQVDTELKRLANRGASEFSKTTSSWDTRVGFDVRKQSDEEYSAGTDNEIYGYVNDGTRPHTIRARDGGLLAFQSGYNAKTTPRQIGSQSGGPFGPTVYAQEVQHPGTAPRDFDDAIAEKLQPEATVSLQRVVTRSLR